jgi:hypothetical protein
MICHGRKHIENEKKGKITIRYDHTTDIPTTPILVIYAFIKTEIIYLIETGLKFLNNLFYILFGCS